MPSWVRVLSFARSPHVFPDGVQTLELCRLKRLTLILTLLKGMSSEAACAWLRSPQPLPVSLGWISRKMGRGSSTSESSIACGQWKVIEQHQ